MAYQLHGGGVVPGLNALPPHGGAQAPPLLVAGVDRISSLPEKARQRILGCLPLKAAVMLGMASKGWSRFVTTPQWPCDSVLAIHVHPGPWCDCRATHARSDQIAPLLATELVANRGRGPGPGHRLLRFFVKVDDTQTRPADLHSLIDYAANCDVEDLSVVVDARRGPPEVSFNSQRTSNHLLRLVLFGVAVKEAHRRQRVRAMNTLEVISIQSTSLGNLDLKFLLLLCPRLRLLTLRHCRVLTRVDVSAATPASNTLVMLAVVECPQVDTISVTAALRLQSFKYVGELLRSVALPPSCFGDLRICFTRASLAQPIHQFHHNWLDALPNLSCLVNLSICSNALKIMSRLHNRGNFQPQVAKLSNLQNLRGLQLVLYAMNTDMLSKIYGFLGMCHCSRLRDLLVQLPKDTTDSFAAAVNELPEEPAMDGFQRLVKVKITNFKWECNEFELVHFLFRKARFMQKLILVVPEGTNPGTDLLGNAIYPELGLLAAPGNVEVQVLTAQ